MSRRPRLGVRRKWWPVIVLGFILIGVWITIPESVEDIEEASEQPPAAFVWLPLANLSFLPHCRNSEQGRNLITDELGYVCRYIDVKPNGCCNTNRHSTQRFACIGCQDTGCCALYEHCISCCLHPDKQPLLRSIRSRAVASLHTVISAVRDQFELCLAKCRTSSLSVQHENSYRDPQAKYCYGVEAPEILQAN
jgi:hypothetical protein